MLGKEIDMEDILDLISIACGFTEAFPKRSFTTNNLDTWIMGAY